MALRFLDSFDHYDPSLGANQATWKWTNGGGFRQPGLHGYGHVGGLNKGMVFDPPTIIMEAYIKTNGPASYFALRDTEFNQQIAIGRTNDGRIEVTRWGDTSGEHLDRVIFTDPDLIRGDTWYHLGWKVFVDPTDGSVEVRLNGAVVGTYTGPTTTLISLGGVPFWSGAIGTFALSDPFNGTVYDDLVVMDAQDDGIDDPRLPGGGGFDKFLGPVEIIVRVPDAPGLLAEWTPAPTVPNWQNVDDLPQPDVDATVNAAAPEALGATDLFAMQDLPPDRDVVAVQSLVCARKTQEGVAAIARLIHESGTTTVGAPYYLPSTYTYLLAIEPTLPDGSLWTRVQWNGIQYGYRRMA